jgi:hypothetical protein
VPQGHSGVLLFQGTGTFPQETTYEAYSNNTCFSCEELGVSPTTEIHPGECIFVLQILIATSELEGDITLIIVMGILHCTFLFKERVSGKKKEQRC